MKLISLTTSPWFMTPINGQHPRFYDPSNKWSPFDATIADVDHILRVCSRLYSGLYCKREVGGLKNFLG